MAALPIDGELNWGAKLNEFLRVAHREDGTLRNTPQVLNIVDFGAIPDDLSATAQTANSAAFVKVQDAMLNDLETWGQSVFVPPGMFYLAGDLHIRKALDLFGTGLQGESILVLPNGSSIIVDPATNADPAHSGAECVIRDLQIHCSPMWTAAEDSTVDLVTLTGPSTSQPAILLQATAHLQRLLIRGFWGTGVYIFAGGETNANQWRILDLYISECGGHGLHVDGGETQGGLCSGAKMISIGGNGVYESSFGGNTYVGCYVEEARGRGYFCDAAGQATFVGCFAESQKPTRLAGGGAVWIGGSSSGFEDSPTALILESFANVHPFEMPHLLNRQIKLLLGYNDNTNALYGWKADAESGIFWLFRWLETLKAWSTEMGNTLPTAARVSYQTAQGHARGAGLQGFPSLLLGPVETEPDSDQAKAIRVETTAISGAAPQSGPYQRGDLIFNAPGDYADSAALPAYVGWVCVDDSDKEHLVWRRFGKIEL